MKEYIVKVREVLEREVRVEAESEEDAERIVINKYNDEELVLDYNDLKENEFEVIEEVE